MKSIITMGLREIQNFIFRISISIKVLLLLVLTATPKLAFAHPCESRLAHCEILDGARYCGYFGQTLSLCEREYQSSIPQDNLITINNERYEQCRNEVQERFARNGGNINEFGALMLAGELSACNRFRIESPAARNSASDVIESGKDWIGTWSNPLEGWGQ